MEKIIIILTAITLTACNSFNPVEKEALSSYPECVLLLNMAEAYKAGVDKSGVVLSSDACLKAIKRERCAKEVFQKKIDDCYVIDWSDKDKIAIFDACMNRLN
jgi:hypothetical protein